MLNKFFGSISKAYQPANFYTIPVYSFGSKKNNMLLAKSAKLKKPKLSKLHKEATSKEMMDELWNKDLFENVKQQDIQAMRVQDVFKRMDSSFEGFFKKREYNLENFNYLLQILAEQKKFDDALKIVEKMKIMGIDPNNQTYTQLLTACAKTQNSVKAEEIFKQAQEDPNIEVGIHMYNSLMLCYTRSHNPDMALAIFREIKNNGLQPDVPIYTTLINAYKNIKNIDKCWEIYTEMIESGCGVPDEFVTGLMIEICAATHDAEKAKMLFEKLNNRGFKQTTFPYNAMIKALGSREEYAYEAIDIYKDMILKGIVPDQDTYVHLFKACGTIGDVKTAYNALLEMRELKLPLNKYLYNGLLRVYGGAFKNSPKISNELRELYIKDAWNIFENMQVIDKVEVNTHLLNSLVYVHTQACEIEKLEGAVLPLYEKYGCEMDSFTFEHIIQMHMTISDIDSAIKLYRKARDDKNINHTFKSLNNFLDCSMKLWNTDMIMESFEDFKKQKKEPTKRYLKDLGNAQNMPDRVYLELTKFTHKYGLADDTKNIRRLYFKDRWSTF